MIPKYIHFIYGVTDDFFNKPFCFFHYLSVLSAKKCNDCEIFLHVKYEPQNNEWWEKTKQLVTLKKIIEIPTEIFGKKIVYSEHKCDILRINILNEFGGIYLDLDTICYKPFSNLLSNSCVMGMEIELNGQINGLCNAVIMATPNNSFLTRWLNAYVDFVPNDWNQMPVRKPYDLYKQDSSDIHVEPVDSFFKYDWHSIIDIFNKDAVWFDGYLIHLWETKLYNPILRHITPEDVMNRKCLYNSIAKKYLVSV